MSWLWITLGMLFPAFAPPPDGPPPGPMGGGGLHPPPAWVVRRSRSGQFSVLVRGRSGSASYGGTLLVEP